MACDVSPVAMFVMMMVISTLIVNKFTTIVGYGSFAIFVVYAFYRVLYLACQAEHSFTLWNMFLACFWPSKLYTKRVHEKVTKNKEKLDLLQNHSVVIKMEDN